VNVEADTAPVARRAHKRVTTAHIEELACRLREDVRQRQPGERRPSGETDTRQRVAYPRRQDCQTQVIELIGGDNQLT
jgi:hypothetical protein